MKKLNNSEGFILQKVTTGVLPYIVFSFLCFLGFFTPTDVHGQSSTFISRCTSITTRIINELDGHDFSDPLYGCQWYMRNRGNLAFSGGLVFPGGTAGEDINVEEVWLGGTEGNGVNVAVIDSGMDFRHEDLADNVNTALNHSYVDGSIFYDFSSHGTSVAGMIAAVGDNGIGIRGVAPQATIYGYNLLRDVTNTNREDAMTRNLSETAVHNNSWGFPDVPRLHPVASSWEMAMEEGVTTGLDGKGIFYTWAGGNGDSSEDQANFEEYANYYAVTAVCSVDKNGVKSSFSEVGVNLWVCAPGEDVPTTVNSNGYTAKVSGTSFATPLVSGVAALVRGTNSELSWRDVKLILAASVRKNDESDPGWETVGVKYGSFSERYNYNSKYGFGVVDAEEAVGLAESWSIVPSMRTLTVSSGDIDQRVPDLGRTEHAMTMPRADFFIEFVEINVRFTHTYFGDLSMNLTSPAGTVSELVAVQQVSGLLYSIVGIPPPRYTNHTHRFGSAKHLGENPSGQWTLRISDNLELDTGTLHSWNIKVYGHDIPPVPAFVTDMIADQRYIQNESINSLTLPPAIHGNGRLSYSLTPLPDGLVFDSGTRVLSGRPTATGSTELTYTVTDEDGDEVTLTFSIEVESDSSPTFGTQTIDDQQYMQRIAITPLTLPVATGGNGQLTYSLMDQPDGLRLENGQLVGIPVEVIAGRTVTYTVTDENGSTDDIMFTVSVVSTDVCDPDATVVTTLNLDGTVTGSIGVHGGLDRFQIDIAADINVEIAAQFTNKPNLINDIVLQLCNSSHNIIDYETSNSSEGENELTIGFRLKPGTYYIDVGLLFPHPVPSPQPIEYEIQVSEDADYNDFLSLCESLTMRNVDEFDGHDFSDPLYGCQWYMRNTGVVNIRTADGDITEGIAGEDINVEDVWLGGTTGSGINVAVVDNGMDFRHEDLADNVNTALNHSYTGGSIFNRESSHGTAIAGMIAAVGGNGTGIRGTAPQATIYGYNLLESSTLANRADAMTRNLSVTAVSNNSWNLTSPSPRFLSASSIWEMAVEQGVMTGFGGKGIFYSWSAGNGHSSGDQANYDGQINHYAVTAVCAVDIQGNRSPTSEVGVNLWVCAPGKNITSTFNNDRYNGQRSGTSFSAPIVSGVAALVRGINSELSWRDVKLILAASARKNDESDPGWEMGALKYGSNSERYNYNLKYGFGVVDAEGAVGLAESWSIVPSMRTLTASSGSIDQEIPYENNSEHTITIPSEDFFIEFVEVGVRFTHSYLSDLDIELVSPGGTVSRLSLSKRYLQQSSIFDSLPLLGSTPSFPYNDYFHRFGSARHLGEDPSGEWTLRISNTQESSRNEGTLHSWNIKVYGHDLPSEPTFGTETIEDQQYARNKAITPLTLPIAIHGNKPLTYSLGPGPLPDGLVFDSGTRVLSGTPTTLGSTDLTYTVQDADGDEDTLTFTITVVADEMPTFGTEMIDDQRYIQNSAITPLTLPAASGGNGDLAYTIVPASPFGLKFDPATRELSGTPAAAGTTMVTYTARDEDGDEVSLTFTISVTADMPPTFGAQTIADQNYINGAAVTPLDLPEATGGTPPLEYSLTGLPAGLRLENRQLVGIPAEVVTDKVVTYTVQDASMIEAMLTFMITVVADEVPDFGTQTVEDQNYINGVAITPLDLPVATGGNAPLVYSFTNLPAGLRLENRQLVGTPTEVAADQTVTYTVRDSDGDEVPLMFNITVAADTVPSFGIQTISDQNYINRVAISPLLLPVATGGNGQLTYSLTGLPAGLRLENGQLVGIPTEAVTDQQMTYTVQDEDGDTVPLPFTITVATATVCDSDGTVLATLNLDGTVTGSIGVHGGLDHFQIDIATGIDLEIVAQFTDTPPLANDIVLQLCNSSHELISAEISNAIVNADNELIIGFGLRPGTYYIGAGLLLHGTEPSQNLIQYEIQVSEDLVYNTFISGCESLTTRIINEFDGHDFSDPLYGCQWHLKNRGSPVSRGGTAGEDINVEDVWLGGTEGNGVNVAVIDSGMDFRHEDLADNVNTALNHSYTGGSILNPESSHGTAVAGMIASVGGNGTGIRGAAPQATIYGYNYTANATSANEADAMTRNLSVTAVSNNSWGDPDVPALHPAPASWEMAVEQGVETGLGGKGIFYSWAAGNGDEVADQANFEEYNNYYAVTSVCSVDNDGVKSSFSEEGVNLWVCAPGEDVTSTLNGNRYNEERSGTSFAAPLVSGVAALLRETNSELSWRDVKLILAASARKNDESDTGWEMGALKYGSNSERYNYNSKYGFGVVDAEEAVGLAESWSIVPSMRTLTVSSGNVEQRIPDLGITALTLTMPNADFFIEFVEINIRFSHSFFADLGIDLISPAGTGAQLMEFQRNRAIFFFNIGELVYNNHSHRFGSARHLGEDPSGEWTLRISDNLAIDTGWLHSWSIKVYGHDLPPEPTFGTETIEDQQYAQNKAITPLTLPIAIHGNKPLTYSLGPGPLPDGLVFDSGTRVLSGTPTTLGSTDLTYMVRDADGDEDTLTFTVTVVPDEMPDFGTEMIEDQQYLQNSAITPLDLPEATGGNAPLAYSFTDLPAGLRLENGQLAGTPTEVVSGRTVTYTVTDADGDEDTITFMITVIADQMPDFGTQTIADQQYIQNFAIMSLELPEAGSGNGDLSYGIAPLPDGLIFDSATRVLSGSPSAVGNTDMIYTAQDEDGDEAMLTFNINVAEDTEPSFGGQTIENQNYINGAVIAPLDLPVATGGNAPLVYSFTDLPAGLRLESGQLTGAPAEVVTGRVVTYTVRDADGDEDTTTFMMNVAEDTVPDFGTQAIADQSYINGVAIAPLGLPVATGGNAPLRYTLTGLPAGLRLESGQLVGTPTEVVTGRIILYTVWDEDGDEVPLTFMINVAEDTVPTFGTQTIEDQNYINGVAITPLDLPVATGGNAPLVYSFTDLPAGLRLESGQLTGTPTEVVTGRVVTYTVRDEDGDEVPLTFMMNVAADTVPDFGTQTIADQSYIENSAVTPLDLPVATGGNAPLAYNLTGLPAGLRLESGQLTGTPTEVVSGRVVTYTVRDTDGDEDTTTFMITVVADQMPDFGTQMIEEQRYIQNSEINTVTLPQASGGNAPLEYSLTMLPDGLLFDSGTRELSGTPAVAGITDMTYTVRDMDGDEVTLTFTINVAEDTRPSFGAEIFDRQYTQNSMITPLTLPQASSGNLPLEYSLTTPPAGLSFDRATRRLTGVPTELGSTDMTYTVTDVDGDEEMLEFSIEIVMDAIPVFNIMVADQNYIEGIEIPTLTLPEATNGDGDLSYGIDPVSPFGLTFDPATQGLSGTPAGTGNQTITYTARDEDGDEATLTFAINVASDTEPSFGTEEIEDQNYINGIAITPLDLPEAMGGNPPLEYTLTNLPAGLRLENGQLAGTPAEVVSGQTATYTATDADGDETPLTFMITVVANTAPDFGTETVPAQNYVEGIAIPTLQLPQAATGGNGDLTYSIDPASPFGLMFNSSTRELSGTPASTGMETVTYKVVDADGDTQASDEDALTFTITVAANTAPDFGSETVPAQNYINGIAITPLTLPQATGGNAPLEYSLTGLPAGLRLENRQLVGTPAEIVTGRIVTYTVMDADGDTQASDTDTVQFMITVAANDVPDFGSETIDDQNYIEGIAIPTLTLPEAASGGNGDSTYSIAPASPFGLTFDPSTRELSGTPSGTGTETITYKVVDGDGDTRAADEDALTFTITVTANSAPDFGSETVADQNYVDGAAITPLTLPQATAGGNGILSYSIDPVSPFGLTFDPATRRLSGTPSGTGTRTITYKVVDGDGDTRAADEDVLTFTITVDADEMPSFSIETVANQRYVQNSRIQPLTLPEVTGGNRPFEYTVRGLPAGLRLENGRLVGTPTEMVTSRTVIYTVRDADGDEITLTFNIEVEEASPRPPSNPPGGDAGGGGGGCTVSGQSSNFSSLFGAAACLILIPLSLAVRRVQRRTRTALFFRT